MESNEDIRYVCTYNVYGPLKRIKENVLIADLFSLKGENVELKNPTTVFFLDTYLRRYELFFDTYM